MSEGGLSQIQLEVCNMGTLVDLCCVDDYDGPLGYGAQVQKSYPITGGTEAFQG